MSSAAYFDGGPVIAIKKGVNILERGSQVHYMAEFQKILDFPPAPQLHWEGKLNPAKDIVLFYISGHLLPHEGGKVSGGRMRGEKNHKYLKRGGGYEKMGSHYNSVHAITNSRFRKPKLVRVAGWS